MNILEKIFEAGVVGAGGAGFPTHIKLKTTVEYFIVNGAECEPFLQTDQYIMRHHPIEIIRAMDIVANQIKAKHIVLALKSKYKTEVQMLKDAIAKENSKIQLFYLENFYPAGDEQMIVYEVTKRSVTPGGIPASIDTVVANVGTMLHIYDALHGQPVIQKYVSVVGDVQVPSVIKVPIGTTISECVQLAGGTTLAKYKLIIGGPMMGRAIDQQQAQKEVVTKTVGGIIVVPEEHYLVKKSEINIEHIQNQTRSACIQCRFCTDLCPRHLIGHPLEPHKIMRRFGQVSDYNEDFKEALICCECGVCELYACPMLLSPKTVNVFLKGELRKKGIRYKYEGSKIEAHAMREYRKVPPERLIARIDMNQYKVTKPMPYQEYEPSIVSIPVQQHIGVAAYPIVYERDIVCKGDPIAVVEDSKIGANIHASISGIVANVSDEITIQKISKEVEEA